jgi:hypothetical protein
LITLQQDTDGFVRMKRHFPATVNVAVSFNDGTEEVVSGRVLNKAFDAALAEYRAENHLDAKGFNRGPKKRVNQTIEFVSVSPGLGKQSS